MQLALDAIAEGILWTDALGVIQWCNRPFDQLVKRSRLDVLGGRISDLLPLRHFGHPVPPEEHPAHVVLDKEPSLEGCYEFTRDGEELIVEIHAACLEGGAQGRNAVLVVRNITSKKKAEEELRTTYRHLQTAQQKLVEAEKLAALGRFSSGLAHEVKNPLAVILGGIEFLEKNRQGVKRLEAQSILQDMKEASFRADNVVKELLQFAKPSPLKLEKVFPQELVLKMLGLLKYRASVQNVRVETRFDQDHLKVLVDKSRIEQVLFNLLLNAVEAMRSGGDLTVRIFSQASEDGGEVCVIEVRDSGQGISKENLSRLYEPFFTTKRDQKGTGLGLSVSKMIVENHRGQLRIDSELGKGTWAQVILPLAQEAA